LSEVYHILKDYLQLLFLYPSAFTIFDSLIFKFVHHFHKKVSPLSDLPSISPKLLWCFQPQLQFLLTFRVFWLGDFKILGSRR